MAALVLLGTLSLVVRVVHLSTYLDEQETRLALTPLRAKDHRLVQLDVKAGASVSSEEPMGRVFHVTKEYGPATFGGLGAVVTTLVGKQAERGIDVQVVMPAYSYLLDKVDGGATSYVTVRFKGESVIVPVYMLREVHAGALVTVRLIGAPVQSAPPLARAFEASGPRDIYYAVPGLDWEVRDVLFNVASAAFLDAAGSSGDIFHMHGATHGFTVALLRQRWRANTSLSYPRILYTLHDYSNEFVYRVVASALPLFMTPSSDLGEYPAHLSNHKYVFPSYYGIRDADAVSVVSVALATMLAQGKVDFVNRVAVEDVLDRQFERGRVVAITNGVAATKTTATNAEAKILAKARLVQLRVLPSEAATKPLVLFIGRFQLNKGVASCADAARLMASLDFTLVLMGQHVQHQPDADAFVKRVRDLGGIVIAGELEQDRVGSLLRTAADIGFVPSRTEAFGLVAVEALAAGALVVSTGVGGLQDFLVCFFFNIYFLITKIFLFFFFGFRLTVTAHATATITHIYLGQAPAANWKHLLPRPSPSCDPSRLSRKINSFTTLSRMHTSSTGTNPQERRIATLQCTNGFHRFEIMYIVFFFFKCTIHYVFLAR